MTKRTKEKRRCHYALHVHIPFLDPRLPTTIVCVPLGQEGNPVPSTPLVRVDKQYYVHNKSSLIDMEALA